MLERIKQSTYGDIVLVVENSLPAYPEKTITEKIKDNLQAGLYKALVKLDNTLFKQNPDAFVEKNLLTLIPDTPRLKVEPIQKKFSDYFSESDIEKIKKHEIDVFIRMGFRILRGEILACARYGVWSYHHGDNRVNRGGPPGFWEVLENWNETGSILQILTEDLDGGKVLYRSYSQTDNLSFRRNSNEYFWKTLSFLPRILEQLYELGGEAFMEKVERDNQHPFLYSKKLYIRPTNAKIAALGFKHYLKHIRKKIGDLFYFDQWILLFRLGNGESLSSSIWKFKNILPPKDRIWADPFVVLHDNKYHVFIEEMLFEPGYKGGKGHISSFILAEDGSYTTPERVLERPYHLSYPFIFSENGAYYMLPETSANRTIELYKCIDFPNRWEKVKILMDDVYAVDSTLLKKDGKWWLFTNIVENDGAPDADELFIFYSEDLFGDRWKPHSQNPVVSDVKTARPAGEIFTYNGNLYRPSQNCTRRYGYGMQINQIIKLTENEYEEISVNDIEPDWDEKFVGVHTFNQVGNLTLIDAEMRRLK